MGITAQIVIVLALLASIGGGLKLWLYEHDKTVKAGVALQVSEARTKTLEEHQEQMQKLVDLGDGLTIKNRKERDELQKRVATYEQYLADKAKSDPVVAAWLRGPVPDAVRLQRDKVFPATPRANIVLRPSGQTPANIGASVERRDERRPVEGSKPSAFSTPSVQSGQSLSVGTVDVAKPVAGPQGQEVEKDALRRRIEAIRLGRKP